MHDEDEKQRVADSTRPLGRARREWLTRLVTACLAVLALASGGAVAGAPKVAVVYSTWGDSSFRNELDEPLKMLGWECEKFENRDLGKLTGRLGDLDIVVLTSVANYDHTQDLAPYKDDWLAFLRRGGALVVTDASYGSVLDQWVGRLGPGFALTSTGCAPHTGAHGGSAQVAFNSQAPLLHVPDDLADALAAKGSIWAHVDSWSPEWTNLATCADGKSVLLTRSVGRGCIVVTSYFSFRGEGGAAAVSRLLGNLWTHLQSARAGVSLERFDVGPARPGKREVILGLRGTEGEPRRVSVTVSVGEGAGAAHVIGSRECTLSAGVVSTVRLLVTIVRPGEVRFAVSLSPDSGAPQTIERRLRVPEPIRMTVAECHLYPYQRKTHVALDITLPMGVAPGKVAVDVSVDGKRKAHVAGVRASAGADLDVSAMQLGQHTVTARLTVGSKQIGMASTRVFRHPMPVTWVRPDGVLAVRGRAFFPFGWYHVSWGFDAADRMAFLRDIASAGFNTVHASIREIGEWQPFLDEAAKLGVKVITEFGTDPMAVISRYKGHQAVLAWNPGDEPDGGGITQDVMRGRHDTFKTADPDHPTYMTLCIKGSYARYVGAADIIAPDPYPLPSSPTSMVHDYISAANKEVRKHQHGLIAVLQCFYYPSSGWSREPTPDEVRNMTYLALLSGAKGIIYYTYVDNQFRVTDHPVLWSAMKRLPAEMRVMEPYVLSGKLTALDTGKADVFSGMWEEKGRTIVCVANTSAKETRSVLVTVPGVHMRKLRPLFADRPAGLRAEGGKMAGVLEPLETDLYEVVR